MPLDQLTRYCSLAPRCESCGASGGGLAVVVTTALAACFCWTACERCAASGRAPSVQLATAQEMADQHTRHVVESARASTRLP